MSLPVPFRSSFAASTLALLEKNASSFRVTDLIFFRGAWTATVLENERRSFRPELLLEGHEIRQSRCLCNPVMKPHDLCRHVAVLLREAHDGEGRLISQEFGGSVWWKIGFAGFRAGLPAPEARTEPDDPRETRLRMLALTKTEQQLIMRGAASEKLRFESSEWYRWSKESFLGGRASEARLVIAGGTATLQAGERETPLSPEAVEHLVTAAPEIVRASGFDVSPETLTPSVKIEITRARELRFAPVLLSATGLTHERAALPRFGRWFLVGDRFATTASVDPMFVERSERGQSSLFEVRSHAGVPVDRETLLAEEEVFDFIQSHREELSSMPEELAPEEVRNAKPLRLDGDVIFEFEGQQRDLFEVSIRFVLPDGGEIAAAEIARARRENVRALIRGHVWIDVTDPQFLWMDDATLGPRGQMLVTKLELLRIRGSIAGRALFRGDPGCEPAFRLFDGATEGGESTAHGLDLYGYQQTGFRWLWLLQQNGFGGLLCDDMGLGKTHKAIAVISAAARLDPGVSALIVCPTSVVDHWRARLERYVPGVPSIVLATYGQVRARIEQFRGRKFDLLILDEAQTIKNSDTATHQALSAIERRVAIGLTGTPIENHEGELRTLLDFVVPGYLPKQIETRAALRRLVHPFVLRRTKEQVLADLPPKIVDKRFCELTPEQGLLYRRVLEARARPLRTQLRAGSKVSYVHIFAALNYLKQICNHPQSAGGGFGDGVTSAKWEMFVELLDECMTSGLKVVVFSQYLSMLAIIEDHLRQREIGYASIKGNTRARGDEIARFRDDPSCRVFTASLRAGGLGIDLTSASVVIHYDRWWNQAREDQATDRVHRLGQNKGVQVLKLITRGTIEEKIDALITAKGTLATDIVRPDDPALVKQFTREELEELLS